MTVSASKDLVFESWWPLPRSLDLVRAPVAQVARHLEAQIARFVGKDTLEAEWVRFESIDAVFRSVDTMTNVGDTFLALPTSSEWTVLWNNSFLCSGYDSLCYCITHFYEVDTLHWSSSDTDGPFSAGTTFSYRHASDGGDVTRSLYCCSDGNRWTFTERGTPLPEEHVDDYKKRIKRERMNETLMMELLARLHAEPWRESFYALAEAPCFRVRRIAYPATISNCPTREVLTAGKPPPPPSEDIELIGPPSYLVGKVRAPDPEGPAALLADRGWCGHGEPEAWIHDLHAERTDLFEVRLPDASATTPAAVRVKTKKGRAFFAYDRRRHPASCDVASTEEPVVGAPLSCPTCGGTTFRLAVGFEVPSDARSADDTSWFALAARCAKCAWCAIVYDDETA